MFAVHGFGGWSAGLEAALSSYTAAGKEMKVQRTAKRYDDDGDGNDVGLRLLLLAAVTMAARALPPQTSRRRMTKKIGTGRTLSQLFIVQRYGAPLCAFNLSVLKVRCRVQGVGCALSFSAQPDPTMGIS